MTRRLLLLLVLVVAAPVAADSAFFQPFNYDLDASARRAAADGKSALFVFFETPDCQFCARMKRTVLNREDIQARYRQDFSSYTLNALDTSAMTTFDGKRTTVEQFARKTHRVRVTPTMVFFDLQGEPVHRQIGIIADPAEFLLLARYVAEAHYNQRSFESFKRAARTGTL